MKLRSKVSIIISLALMIGSILVFFNLAERPLWVKILLAFIFSVGIAVLQSGSKKPPKPFETKSANVSASEAELRLNGNRINAEALDSVSSGEDKTTLESEAIR